MVHQMNLRSGRVQRKPKFKESVINGQGEGSETVNRCVEDIADEDSCDECDGIPDFKSQPFYSKASFLSNVEQVWTRTSNIDGGQILDNIRSEFIMGCAIAAIFILVFALLPIFPARKGNLASVGNSSLFELYQEYPQHKSFWKAINTTYKTCSRADKPGVILVLYNKDGCVANCLVNQAAETLSKLLGVNDNGQFHLVNCKTVHKEYKEDRFLSDIMEQRESLGVVVFTHFEQMDSKLVKSIHFISDKDPNMSDKAIIILLLRVDMQTFEVEDLSDVAAGEIEKLWGQTLQNRLDPIIGRITNVVAGIDETIVTKCP